MKDMADLQVGEMKLANELRVAQSAFSSAVEGIKAPSSDEEAQIRQIMQGVTLENFDDRISVNAAPSLGQPQIPVQVVQQQAPVEIPQKFQRPDGTVDEDKLKASTENLQQAIEKKATTIEEALARYKELEKKHTELGVQAKQLPIVPPISSPAQTASQSGIDPQLEQVRQQLLALQREDPIAFAVEISKAVSRKEASEIAAPALLIAANIAEERKDSTMRTNLASLAEKDPRIMNPELYQTLMDELNSDPAYFRLKNPHKAAWNEVKERMRLGEPNTVQTQPSTPGPTLGRGTPPSVPTLSGNTNVYDQIRNPQLNPNSADGRRIEDEFLRKLAENTWR